MALAPGSRLGVYDVTAQIGEGGMGQVWRATDTTLGRQVAIKILPDAFAADPERLARFEREARTLASLNHPHIAAIYGFEKSSGMHALVMELVEGEDLSRRIARGAIPIDEALPIAKQIAEALEAAHEQGIIHRDLKPANIKVRSDGAVKVLDFGLAKAMGPLEGDVFSRRQAEAEASALPTITTPAMPFDWRSGHPEQGRGVTQAGMILGTAAYMSPEQASGKAVDKRADVWSFGVVLLEMLTGRRLFAGETVPHTLADVLRGPLDFSRLPADTPRTIRDLLRRCLTRDVKKRTRDIGEARIAIDEALTSPTSVDTIGSPIPDPRSLNPSRSAALPWALATALSGALLMLWAPWRAEMPVDRPLLRLDVDLGADVSFPATIPGSSILISPDGTRLVFVSGTPTRLFTRRLDQPKATELPGTQGAYRPFFSPDGQWVGFQASGKLHKISVDGGAVVPLAEAAGFTGASWAEDGSIFVGGVNAERGLLQLPAAGGTPKIVVPRGNGGAAITNPHLLPGGTAVLFAAPESLLGGVDKTTIEVLSLVDGRRKIVVRGGQSPHYLPSSNGTGHLLYLNKATLFAIPFDLENLETRGTAVPVLDDVAHAQVVGAGQFAVSRTGAFIYRRLRSEAAAMRTLQWASPSAGATAKTEPLRATPGAYRNLRLSPEGTRIALTITEGASDDVWVHDPQRDAMTRLTFGGVNHSPTWSPDGQYVVFEKVGQGIFQARVDGASPLRALTGSTSSQTPWSFTPDGKRLAYFEFVGGTDNSQIWTVSLEDQGGRLKAGKPELFLKSTFSDRGPSFSPDGRWLAYSSNESGRDEVYVRAFPPPSSGQGGKWQISNNGGDNPHWSLTGHQLVYQSGNQLMTASYSVNGNTFVADKPRVWIATLGTRPGIDPSWDLAPDGKRVAVVIPEGSAQTLQPEHVIVMLLNFADELRRLVPLGK